MSKHHIYIIINYKANRRHINIKIFEIEEKECQPTSFRLNFLSINITGDFSIFFKIVGFVRRL